MIPLAKPLLDGNERAYLMECIDNAHLSHVGRFEDAFEAAFSRFVGRPALATSSGTAALHLALLSLGVGAGDEVIVPDITFAAPASVVLAVGARPLLVDLDPETWGMDRDEMWAGLKDSTRAIIAVHLYGEDAGDYSEFGVPVIEDACEALGFVPACGTMTAYSFYGNKMLVTGEGGMLCGDFRMAREWRDGGFDGNYRNEIPGLNYRMTNMQAAVGLAQLEHLPQMLDLRSNNIRYYQERIRGRGKWLFAAETRDPKTLQSELRERGVETRPVFTPLHRSPAFERYGHGEYPVADAIWRNHLCLPTGPHLTQQQLQLICEVVREHQ